METHTLVRFIKDVGESLVKAPEDIHGLRVRDKVKVGNCVLSRSSSDATAVAPEGMRLLSRAIKKKS